MKSRIISMAAVFALVISVIIPASIVKANSYASDKNGGYINKAYYVEATPKLDSYTLENNPIGTKVYGGADASYWSKFSDNYFYNNLNANEKNFYSKLKIICDSFLMGNSNASKQTVKGDGDSNKTVYLLPGTSFSGLTSEMAMQVYIVLSNANPQYYFLSGSMTFGSNNNAYPVIFDKYADGENRAAYTDKFISKINEMISIVDRGSSLIEKERNIYTLLAQRLRYSEDSSWDPHQSTATAVFEGSTVCAGYSELFALLAKAVGIQTIVITSEGHEWVQVKLGDYWYNADITMDDGGSEPRWRYFNVSDATMTSMDGNNNKNSHKPEAIFDYLKRPKCQYNYGSEPKKVTTEPQVSSGTIYRLYNPGSGEHLYTTSVNELNSLKSAGWKEETSPGKSSEKGTAVYRVFNPGSGEHLYVTENEGRVLTGSQGWKYDNEGKPMFYGDSNGKTPVYRLFNPGNPSVAAHHYTSDANEASVLISGHGWQYDNGGAAVYKLM